MIKIVKKITLDVAKENIFSPVIAKQFDKASRYLQVQLTNEGTAINIETTSVVKINALREDGVSKSFGGTVNSDGTVTVPIAAWMLELDGYVNCDISIYDSERKLTSIGFKIYVEAATSDGDDMGTDDGDESISTIANAVASVLKNDVTEIATAAVNEAISNGNMLIGVVYNAENEAIDIITV